MNYERLHELDEKVLRYETAESVLREIGGYYPERMAEVIIPALAMVIATNNRTKVAITALEKEEQE